MNARCKIGRVIPKKVVLLNNRGSELRRDLHARLDSLLDSSPEEAFAGFIIVGWDKDFRASARWNIRKENLVGTAFLPSFIAEVVRMEIGFPAQAD